MTKENFITEDKCSGNIYLYETRMFTNKVNQSIVWGGPKMTVTLGGLRKEWAMNIPSGKNCGCINLPTNLLSQELEKALEGARYLSITKIS